MDQEIKRMKKSCPPAHSSGTQTGRGRPSSLTNVEERRYVSLRNWAFSQREAGALARNLPRGRGGIRPPLSASTCQRLDGLHGPFEGTVALPQGHSADSLRKLPERALVALADARGDVSNRKYQEAAGLQPVVKRARPVAKPAFSAGNEPAQSVSRAVAPQESVEYLAWQRANSVLNAFQVAPSSTMKGRLAYVREWCSQWSRPVELDANARSHLTAWEQIAATWDGEFIADCDREVLLLPFADATHPRITPARQEAIFSARRTLQSERPPSIRKFELPPIAPDEWDDETYHG